MVEDNARLKKKVIFLRNLPDLVSVVISPTFALRS